ncbi:MAG: helix-hairpin-helix domain-containing protein [Actinobacteria bacterium]|nr:helix-hairpin-helix domain-containing protein [Actinomycetota bacterium]
MNLEDFKSSLSEKFSQENSNSWQFLSIGILAILIIAGSFILYNKSLPSSKPIVIEETSKTEEKKETKKLTVHIAGAVLNPGVYQLDEGKRVIDAINLAGGASPDANVDSLNLASRLSDGQKIMVPKKGEILTASSQTDSSLDSTNQTKIGLNSATVEQLDSLSGIGPVIAKRIVDYRETHGRFTKIDQLMEVEGIGSKKFNQIKDKVILD